MRVKCSKIIITAIVLALVLASSFIGGRNY
jgi:hypothetical protein